MIKYLLILLLLCVVHGQLYERVFDIEFQEITSMFYFDHQLAIIANNQIILYDIALSGDLMNKQKLDICDIYDDFEPSSVQMNDDIMWVYGSGTHSMIFVRLNHEWVFDTYIRIHKGDGSIDSNNHILTCNQDLYTPSLHQWRENIVGPNDDCVRYKQGIVQYGQNRLVIDRSFVLTFEIITDFHRCDNDRMMISFQNQNVVVYKRNNQNIWILEMEIPIMSDAVYCHKEKYVMMNDHIYLYANSTLTRVSSSDHSNLIFADNRFILHGKGHSVHVFSELPFITTAKPTSSPTTIISSNSNGTMIGGVLSGSGILVFLLCCCCKRKTRNVNARAYIYRPI